MGIHCEMTTVIKWINASLTSDMGISQVAHWDSIYLPVQETQETRVWFLGWKGPLEEEAAAHASTFAWEVNGQRSLVGYSPRGHRVGHDWVTEHTYHLKLPIFFRCMMLALLIFREIKPQRVITSYLLEWVSSIRWEKIMFFQDVENRDPVKHCWSECKWIQPLWKTMWFMFNTGYRMLGAGARGWSRKMIWGGRWEGGIRIGNPCTPVADSCQWMAKPIQYCKVK